LKDLFIPEYLQPNYDPFYFHFSSKTHILSYEKKISPRSVKKFLESVFSNKEIVKNYGSIGVSVIQNEQILSEIFSLSYIKRIDITLFRPNPDDHGSLDDIMMNTMEKSGASEIHLGIVGASKTGVVATEEIKSLSKLALRHGEVEARGYDPQNNLVVRSSKNHPVTEKISYDPEVSSDRDTFRKAVLGYRPQ